MYNRVVDKVIGKERKRKSLAEENRDKNTEYMQHNTVGDRIQGGSPGLLPSKYALGWANW